MQISGYCYVLMAFEFGWQANLDMASRQISAVTKRLDIAPRHRAPKHFEYSAKPLRITQQTDPIKIGEFQTSAMVDMVVFDFACVSLCYSIPFKTSLDGLLGLSDMLYENVAIRQDAKNRANELLSAIKSSVTKPHLTDAPEDYLVFEISRSAYNPPHQELISHHRQEIAQILRSEKLILSEQEVNEALFEKLSYTPNDSVIINWNAAFVCDDEAEDVRAVLEFANVQLLQLRLLDSQLDFSLDQSYDLLSKRQKRFTPLLFQAYADDLKRVAQMQIDGALLFEGVSSSLKLLGDQYLSRVYNTAARRLFLPDWDRSIRRKLDALQGIYQKMEDKVDSVRMQVMELIIVLLILVEIVTPFVPWWPK